MIRLILLQNAFDKNKKKTAFFVQTIISWMTNMEKSVHTWVYSYKYSNLF